MENFGVTPIQEKSLTNWSLVKFPEIYKYVDSPETAFTKLDCSHSIALFGRAKNDLRHDPQTGAYADGHHLVTTPIVEVRGGKFYTENSIYAIDEREEDPTFKVWCSSRQYTVPLDGWSAKEEQSKLVLRHICEICGREELLTSEEEFQQGWDYPPRLGEWGKIFPRTCGNCTMQETLWFEIACNKTPIEQLSERHRQTLKRILAEPESILSKSDSDMGIEEDEEECYEREHYLHEELKMSGLSEEDIGELYDGIDDD